MYGLWNGLSWDDWFYLSQQKISLRYYNNDATAMNDLKNGGFGDACSLVMPLLDDPAADKNIDILFGLQPNPKGVTENYIYSQIFDRFLLWKNRISGNAKGTISTILPKLRTSKTLNESKKHITDIFNILLYDWISYCVDKDAASSYMLVKKNDSPYDFDNYPLGKNGSAAFTSGDAIVWMHGDNAQWSKSPNFIFYTILTSITKLRKNELVKAPGTDLVTSPASLQISDPDALSWKPFIVCGAIALAALGLFALSSNNESAAKEAINNSDVNKLLKLRRG